MLMRQILGKLITIHCILESGIVDMEVECDDGERCTEVWMRIGNIWMANNNDSNTHNPLPLFFTDNRMLWRVPQSQNMTHRFRNIVPKTI
jgi:uncharacterized membrane protein YcgQ (UPF0703/DUF1980 family)